MAVTLDPVVSSPKGKGISIDGERHRMLIGSIGALLPFILIGVTWIRPTNGLDTLLESLSTYYYSSAIAVLEGILVALALFLWAYEGYPNKYQWADKLASKVAAVSAFVIAFCPTYPPGYPSPPAGVGAPLWWSETIGKTHNWWSAVMFTMFAVFSLWLFRLTDQKKDQLSRGKRWRNRLYLICGLTIVVSAIVVAVRLKSGQPDVFVAESIAIGAFAVSWLVKGGALARWLPD